MQGNFIMLQKDDLKQVVSELVEELVGKKSQPDLTSEESDEYYTRDQVCERQALRQTCSRILCSTASRCQHRHTGKLKTVCRIWTGTLLCRTC